MASFQSYETKKGKRWLYKYYGAVDPKTGKKTPSTKRGFETKKEAQIHAREMERNIERGMVAAVDKKTTFEELFGIWHAKYSRKVSRGTSKLVQLKFVNWTMPFFGKLRMCDITLEHCEKYVLSLEDAIREGKIEFSSARDTRMYANMVFKYALRYEFIAINHLASIPVSSPVKGIKSAAKEEENYLEKEELKQLLEVAPGYGEDFYDSCYVLAHTGLRKGEWHALSIDDYLDEERALDVYKTLYHESGSYYIEGAKTESSRRVVGLDGRTDMIFRRRIARIKERLLAQGKKVTGKELIFAHPNGKPFRLAYLNDKLKQVIHDHKIKEITVHGLRHTHASLLFEAGATIKEVQERLGHSDIKITMNIYTHVTKAVKEKTAQRFEAFMNE